MVKEKLGVGGIFSRVFFLENFINMELFLEIKLNVIVSFFYYVF